MEPVSPLIGQFELLCYQRQKRRFVVLPNGLAHNSDKRIPIVKNWRDLIYCRRGKSLREHLAVTESNQLHRKNPVRPIDSSTYVVHSFTAWQRNDICPNPDRSVASPKRNINNDVMIPETIIHPVIENPYIRNCFAIANDTHA